MPRSGRDRTKHRWPVVKRIQSSQEDRTEEDLGDLVSCALRGDEECVMQLVWFGTELLYLTMQTCARDLAVPICALLVSSPL